MNKKLKIQTLDIDEVTDLALLEIRGQGCLDCDWDWVKQRWRCFPCLPPPV
jgi:hypothetical protein